MERRLLHRRGSSPRRAGRAGPAGPREPRPSEPLRIVAIAASTGGPPAVAQILRALPADWPVPVLVVQHIGVGFDAGLVRHLDECCPLAIAQDQTTSIVYGMPRQALLQGAAAEVLPVEDIARTLIARAAH